MRLLLLLSFCPWPTSNRRYSTSPFLITLSDLEVIQMRYFVQLWPKTLSIYISMVVAQRLTGSNWHRASRGPSATAESLSDRNVTWKLDNQELIYVCTFTLLVLLHYLVKQETSLSHLFTEMPYVDLSKETQKQTQTRMWANDKRDGRPAEYRWRPLFNAAKFGWRPLPECCAVTLPRRETRWNLQGCPKLTKGSQPLVGRSSPYYEDMWRRYCCLTSFFSIVNMCLSCEDIVQQSCAMVRIWRFFASCISSEQRAAHFRHAF